MYGALQVVAKDPLSAFQSTGSTMVGIGATPEAIEHNPVMYDIMFEMGWRHDFFDIDAWYLLYSCT
jgi:alpha-N-acetylglucosaminidase